MPLPSTTSLLIPSFSDKKQFECDLCRIDLTFTARIRCAVCDEYDLCLTCVQEGVAGGGGKVGKGGHDPMTHGYHVAGCTKFPLFVQSCENSHHGSAELREWSAEDEMRLLTGIGLFGLGNWIDISEHVKTKSASQCSRHYLTDWCGEYGRIVPEYMQVTSTADNTVKSVLTLDVAKVHGDDVVEDYFNAKVPEGRTKGGAVANREDLIRRETHLTKCLQAALSEEEAAAIKAEALAENITLPPTIEEQEAMPGSELNGYMVRRGDFDVEWDQDAEQTIADMEFSEKDTPSDRELKLAVLTIYNKKLEERQKRKQFVIDRKLLDYRTIQMKDFHRPPAEREMVQRMRIFERFSTPAAHEKIVEQLLKAKEIREDIEKLQMYRLLGIETVKEAEEYEAEKKRRAEADEAGVPARKKAKVVEEEATVPMADSPVPGANFCSPTELSLCSELKLEPGQYLAIKDQLITAMMSKNVDKTTKGLLAFLDVGVVLEGVGERVLEFVVKAGWARTKPSM